MRGGIACEQCQFQYVDVVKWRHPLWTVLAPVAFGIAGAILQVLPLGIVLLWHFLRGTERPHDLCNPLGMGLPKITEVQILSGFWEKVLRLILLYSPPDEPASGCLAASRNAIIEQIPLLECMTPRIVTGFLAVFTVSIYHLALRAARTAYPPLRVAHAALLEPAQGLSVVWGLRSGMIAYELLSRRLMSRRNDNPGALYFLFAALPYLLPEPLEATVQDLGGIEHLPRPVQEMKQNPIQS
ncbi:hypothetical protein FRC00_000697 [Tulasnella sp. 408]|nr:hypothetical protein FRC00_000697 [Tulasnella sp. 408]